MRARRRRKLSKVVSIVGALAVLAGVVTGAIIYRSPDIEQEQSVFPLGLTVSPNPFPGAGLDQNGRGRFEFELTVWNSLHNPNLTVTVNVVPSTAVNLTVFHCLENTQLNLSSLNAECDKGQRERSRGEYVVNVTSGSSEVLMISVLFVGTLSEPVSITWLFFAEGEEFLSEL